MIKQFIDRLLGRSPAADSGAHGDAPPARTSKAGKSTQTSEKTAAKTATKAAAKKTRTRQKPTKDSPFGQRRDVPVSEHRIDPGLVDKRALEVVRTLQDAGYEAYIVGGAVRDLLLDLRPKDFDVATNATPEQVKALFRRTFIIGRRFRIVHVVFGRGREHEVIEVTTFRAYLDNADADRIQGNEKTSRKALAGVQHAVDASGRVLRDNVWGSQQEDAARRDFSINAMYYDPRSQIVVDYHGGIEDARNHTIRMIGQAETRYREDPVRMLRAIRFAAKLDALGFTLDAATARPIALLLPLLEDIPPSRMFDEMLKLLQTGHAEASIAQLRTLGLTRGVYPLLDLAVERSDWPIVRTALRDTDHRIAKGRPVAPSFLLACLLWDDVQKQWQNCLAQGQHPTPALSEAIDIVFDRRVGEVSGRGRLGADMREIWMMQPRFERRSGKSANSLVAQPRFRAALDFLRLRGGQDSALDDLWNWWERYSLSSDAERAELLEEARLEAEAQRAGKAISKAISKADPADHADHDSDMEPGAPHAPAKTRKRRRRKSKAAGDAQATDAASANAAETGEESQNDNLDDDNLSEAPLADAAAPAARKRRRRRRKPAPPSDE